MTAGLTVQVQFPGEVRTVPAEWESLPLRRINEPTRPLERLTPSPLDGWRFLAVLDFPAWRAVRVGLLRDTE
jgi:hypothetical protein